MGLPEGTQLGVFVIAAPLGTGGIGEVYRATDTRLGRPVAIKVLRPELARQPGARAQFEREARAVSQLNHPHICTLHDIGRERVDPTGDEVDFLVMELIDGEALSQVLARGPMPLARVVRHGVEMSAALEEAHAHALVHGDLKPGNIMSTKFGMKLLDFGLARQLSLSAPTDLTRTSTSVEAGVVAGTLPYMAPEVLRGAPPDARSDLWALGIVMHEMATGVRPFTGRTEFDLSAAILHQPPATAAVWVPLGIQTIIARCLAKDLAERYQRASEVRAALEAVQSDPAVAPPLPAALHNLPLQLTPFIGRERELGELRPMVATERLLTLTGAGGAGKSRLALRLAEELVGNFPHGVWLVELAPLSDPDLIANTIASTIGMRHEAGQGTTDALIEFLRPRTTLLVLDNCEHLIAACAALVTQILRACPRVRVLASSREALGIGGERAWRVPSLALPDLRSRPSDEDMMTDAVRFFLDRARALAPQFVVPPQSLAIVARICQRLDGIPLAIELAAARLKLLSLDQIGARLDDRFQLLTGGSRGALPRQHTLRATIDWSYGLLSEAERALLRQLSVFAGGFTLEAAEHVCRDTRETTIDLLSHLVDKSLVSVDEEGPDRRYHLLETVRQYARDRLMEHGEAASMRDRHFRFFSAMAAEAAPKVIGPEQIAWLQRLELEHDNLRAALEWSFTRHADSDAPLQLACALWPFWNRRNHFAEGQQWLERGVAACPHATAPVRAHALVAIADLAFFAGDWGSVQKCCDEVLAQPEADLGWARWTRAMALFGLANQAANYRRFDETVQLAERSLEMGRETGTTWVVSLALIAPAYVAMLSGDPARAHVLMEESVALARPLGDRWLLATVLFNLSAALVACGDFARATAIAREGIVLSHHLNDTRNLTWCLTALAASAAAQQQHRHAVRLWGGVHGQCQSIGAPLPAGIAIVFETYVPGLRQSLGETDFSTEWSAGRSMKTEALVEYALVDSIHQ